MQLQLTGTRTRYLLSGNRLLEAARLLAAAEGAGEEGATSGAAPELALLLPLPGEAGGTVIVLWGSALASKLAELQAAQELLSAADLCRQGARTQRAFQLAAAAGAAAAQQQPAPLTVAAALDNQLVRLLLSADEQAQLATELAPQGAAPLSGAGLMELRELAQRMPGGLVPLDSYYDASVVSIGVRNTRMLGATGDIVLVR